jgi:D-alanine-D-alanine ligase
MMNGNIPNLPHTRPLIAKQNHNGGKLPAKVAIIYTDEKREYFFTEEEFTTVEGSRDEALSFAKFFNKLGIETCFIAGNTGMAKKLQREKPDLALNLVTTVKGYDYLGATVPSTLELLEIPYTGASILGFAIGSNKHLIYTLLSAHGITVPPFQLMTSIRTPLDPTLKFPLILKLNEEHSNVEITHDSVVENEKELRKRLKYLLHKYEQDVLVSEFIDGREFASFIFQAYNKKVYTVERQIHMRDNKTTHEFLDYDLCWGDDANNPNHLKYVKYKDSLLDSLVKKAYSITKMASYGKFDIRMDQFGKYYFIDANVNCHFGPDPKVCEMTDTLSNYGVPFKLLLKRLLQNTMREWGY